MSDFETRIRVSLLLIFATSYRIIIRWVEQIRHRSTMVLPYPSQAVHARLKDSDFRAFCRFSALSGAPSKGRQSTLACYGQDAAASLPTTRSSTWRSLRDACTRPVARRCASPYIECLIAWRVVRSGKYRGQRGMAFLGGEAGTDL